MDTFHFVTFPYCFVIFISQKAFIPHFLKDNFRFWNKNVLLAASADFIKSCTLARNTDMKDSAETPRKCFRKFFFFSNSFQKMQKCPQTTAFPRVFNLPFPRGQPFRPRASHRAPGHPLYRAGLGPGWAPNAAPAHSYSLPLPTHNRYGAQAQPDSDASGRNSCPQTLPRPRYKASARLPCRHTSPLVPHGSSRCSWPSCSASPPAASLHRLDSQTQYSWYTDLQRTSPQFSDIEMDTRHPAGLAPLSEHL